MNDIEEEVKYFPESPDEDSQIVAMMEETAAGGNLTLSNIFVNQSTVLKGSIQNYVTEDKADNTQLRMAPVSRVSAASLQASLHTTR